MHDYHGMLLDEENLENTSVGAMEAMLRSAVRRVREHDGAIDLWKYLYR